MYTGRDGKKKRGMYGRAIVPVFDEEMKWVIGVTGRGIYDGWTPKWLHSDGFPACNSLYNYWYSKEYIKNSKTAILVESPGNVWRLEESGFHNAVGIWGGSFSMAKQLLLDQLGVMNLTVIMDNDEAGIAHAKKIVEECSGYYNIKVGRVPEEYNDIGEMKIEDVKNLLRMF